MSENNMVEAFKQAQGESLVVLGEIALKLGKLDPEFDTITWGHTGDMKRVLKALKEINEFV